MTLSTQFKWDQTRFDAALRAKLDKLKGDKVPRAVNKAGFYVALAAFSETPKKEPFDISRDVGKMTTVTNRQGQIRTIPMLWVLAAKRVGKKWPELKMMRGERKTRGGKILATSAGKLYLKTLAKKSDVILGSRKRASGFFRVGFLSIIKRLGPLVRNKGPMPDMSGAKIKGQLKGDAKPATAGIRPTCTIIHSAQARSDKGNGLFRIVGPALQRGIDKEAAQIENYLKEETAKELNGKID